MDAGPTSVLGELARDPVSRKRFLRMAGGGALAASLSALIAACGDDDDEQIGNGSGGAGVGTAGYGQGDAGIVAYALALEQLEVDFYRAAVDSGKLRGRGLELAKRFGEEEASHAKTLTGALSSLGGRPAAKPTFSFPLPDEQSILTTAAQIEGLGAGAYLAQAPRIQSKKVLAAALSIHSVEGRHAAALAQLLGRPITPDGAFASPATSVDVLSQIQPFIASQ